MGPKLLKKIVDELNSSIVGGVVSKVHQPGPRRVVLKIFSRGATASLLISAEPTGPRMHLTGRAFTNPPRPLRFCALLRSRITNARVKGLSVAEGERIVRLGLASRGGGELTLIIELTGKSSNIILVEDGVVVDALRYFEGTEAMRVVSPGEPFTPLPSPPRTVTAREELPERTLDTWNESADELFSEKADKESLELDGNRLKRALRAAAKRARKKARNLEGDRVRALSAIEGAKKAELLLANFHLLERGMSEVTVTDYYTDPPGEITIELDPAAAPQGNVDRLFKRAGKGKTTLKHLAERLPAVEAELNYIAEQEYSLDAAKDEEGRSLIEGELIRAGYIKAPAREARGATKKPAEKSAEPVRRVTLKGGETALVGRSGAGNDLLVKRYGRGRDLWFHIKGMPGAHVLLKVEAKSDPTEEAVHEAALIAAQNSRAKGESKAEVICAEIKEVKKPKGSRPGTVAVGAYKSILVKPAEG